MTNPPPIYDTYKMLVICSRSIGLKKELVLNKLNPDVDAEIEKYLNGNDLDKKYVNCLKKLFRQYIEGYVCDFYNCIVEPEIKTMELRFDEDVFKSTKGYIDSIKTLMLETLKMMSNVHAKECWVCAGCIIGDLSESNHLRFRYGSKEEIDDIKKDSDIFVELK